MCMLDVLLFNYSFILPTYNKTINTVKMLQYNDGTFFDGFLSPSLLKYNFQKEWNTWKLGQVKLYYSMLLIEFGIH